MLELNEEVGLSGNVTDEKRNKYIACYSPHKTLFLFMWGNEFIASFHFSSALWHIQLSELMHTPL